MSFRVVDKSSFTFETDLPPSCRDIHPSGVLHAFRCHGGNQNNVRRQEHAFAWIANAIHVESAISHLERFGFDRSNGLVFIPYSTKTNWLDRYPHAAPALECLEDGKLLVYLNWRPYPNGLGELGQVAGNADGKGNSDPLEATMAVAEILEGDSNNHDATSNGDKKKRVNKSRSTNMVQDASFLPDAQRDELHIEIYNYLSWLHGKLDKIEKEEAAVAESNNASNSMDDDNDQEDEKNKKKAARPKNSGNGVDVSELQTVVTKLESAFLVIPHVKKEQAAALKKMDEQQDQGEEAQKKGAPFLEEILEPVLTQLVEARLMEGKPKRRCRQKIRPRSVNNPRVVGEDFDEMYQKMVEYQEEHGHCRVFKNYKDEHGDGHLANWVRGVRERRQRLARSGIEFEEAPLPESGKPLPPRALTAERIEKLNSIGFPWTIGGPQISWESRFADLMDYYETNGRWPSQSMGSLGEWVHKQRGLYARNDSNYMKHKAPRLDEVGFEWTPRGNTRMKWDEGFDLLMEFGRINGHFNVPNPSRSSGSPEDDEEDGKPVDKKSDAYRLYKWVESLHGMYRSYKLGRQSGSLTDERVVLLIKHGFVFRNSVRGSPVL